MTEKFKQRDIRLIMNLVNIINEVLSLDEYKGSSFEYYDRIFTWDQHTVVLKLYISL